MSVPSLPRIALVGMNPNTTKSGPANDPVFPSYGIRRIEAAVRSDARLAGAEVRFFEGMPSDADELLRRVEEFEPTIVGLSVYLWSFAEALGIARRIRARAPDVTIVLGGPSARPVMFTLEPYADARGCVDALVIGDGEDSFCEIAALADRSPESLRRVAGIAIPTGDGFHHTPKRRSSGSLDHLASPAQLGLLEANPIGYVETFRGCPMSCAFCQWGIPDEGIGIFSQEYLERELHALERARPEMVFAIDAGLNLSPRAFRNFAAAERNVRLFKKATLVAELYPSLVTDEHLAFLAECKVQQISIGIQSFDAQVNVALGRPFREQSIERAIERLSAVVPLTAHLILGLPDEDPANFRASFERLRDLPIGLHVFHALVLPDALMSRAPAGADVRFDPKTLKMISCRGWPEATLRAEADWVGARAAAEGGFSWESSWLFPPSGTWGTRSREPSPPEVAPGPHRRLPVL